MKPVYDEDRDSSPWRVSVGIRVTGVDRKRFHFGSEEQADGFIIAIRQRGYHSACEMYSKGESEVIAGLRVSEGWERWKAFNAKKPKTLKQLTTVMKSFVKRHGRRPIADITHRECAEWLATIKGSGTNQVNHHRVARRFFKYLVEWLEAIPRNPMVKVPRPDDNDVQRAILKPEEVYKAILLAAAFPDPVERRRLVFYLCLGAFAGLRTEEILATHAEDLHWNDGEIYVRQPKQVRGWRPRYVKIEPIFERIVKLFLPQGAVVKYRGRGDGGKFTPTSEKIFPGGQRSLYISRKKLTEQMGLKQWPKNCLRHSWSTYHLAQFKNAPLTAEEGGHEVVVMKKHYAQAAKRVTAAAWWNPPAVFWRKLEALSKTQ